LAQRQWEWLLVSQVGRQAHWRDRAHWQQHHRLMTATFFINYVGFFETVSSTMPIAQCPDYRDRPLTGLDFPAIGRIIGLTGSSVL